MISEAGKAGIGPDYIRLILVTHGHLDHYGAATELREWCGAPVAAHRTAPGFSRERRNAIPPAQTLRGSIVRGFYLLLAPLIRFEPLKIDLSLDDGASLRQYGVDATILLVPGHSPGSLAVVTADGAVLVGDLIVNYTVPSQPIYVLDRAAWQRSYERVRSLKPRVVYVGHGDPFPGEKLDKIYPARYQLRWWVR